MIMVVTFVFILVIVVKILMCYCIVYLTVLCVTRNQVCELNGLI